MARYWVTGGDGNWNNTNNWSDTTGGSSGSSVPTSSDDVYFDSSSGSGTSTVNVESNCLGLDFTGFTGTLAGTAVLNIHGSLEVVSGMTRTYSGNIYFKATTTGHTVTTNGKTLANMIYFSGISGGWILQDNLTNNSSDYIYLQNGTLDLNGKTVSTGRFNIYGTSTRTLTMGAASVYCTGTNYASWNAQTTTNLTFNVGTSYIKSRGMEGGGLTYYDFEAYYSGGSLTIYGTNTYHDLTITGDDEESWSGDDNATINNNVTVTNDFTITGYSQRSCIILDSGDYNDQTTITCNGTVSITDASFYGIIGAGSASWTGTRVGDCGNNSGITFTTATDKYWVGNGGCWNDTTHWSTSSGGSSGATIPLPQDTAYFDSSSFSTTAQTVYLRKVILPKISMSGVTDSPTFDGNEYYYNSIYGDLTLCSGITFEPHYFNFRGASDTILDTAGITINATSAVLITKKVGNKLTLNSHLTVDYSADIGFEALNGTLDLNNYNVTCYRYNTNYSTETPTLYMGDGTMTIKGTGYVFSKPDGTLYSEESTIIIDDTSATLKTFSGYDETYNNLTITGDNVKITGSNTFHTLTLNNDGLTNGTLFEAGETQTINTLDARGTSGNLVVIQSTSSGSAATISKSSGVVSCDYLSVKDSTATGGASWYAGANSTSVSGNSGWTFSGAPGRYWVSGGDGNWNNTNNWSTSSGGSSGASVPTSSDDVFFDENSGSGTSTVNADSNCKNLDFTGFTGTLAGSEDINIYDSLTLASGMTASFSGDLYFLGTDTHTITSNGRILASVNLYVGPDSTNGGTYNIQDTLDLGYSILSLRSGTLNTNNNTITAALYLSGTTTNNRTLNLGSSTIEISGLMLPSYYTLTFDAGTSEITFKGNSTFSGGDRTYYNLIIAGSNTYSSLSGANTFNNLTINGTSGVKAWYCNVSGNQTVTGTFTANGTSITTRVWIKSSSPGTSRTITAATVSLSNVDFSDITGAGVGTWSGTSVGNGLGNSGITFTTPVTRYWVDVDGGNWSATSSWSTSSGGGSGASVPLCHDTVIFNSNSITSGSRTITADMDRLGVNLDFSNILNSPTLSYSDDIVIFGNLNLTGLDSATSGSTDYITIRSRSSPTITSGGTTVSGGFLIYAPGTTITLTDNLVLGGQLSPHYGTFDASDKNITTSNLYGQSAGTIYMGNGTWTITGTSSVWNYSGTLHCEGSTVIVNDAGTGLKPFYPRDDTFNNITIATDNLQFYAYGFTCNTLTINNAGGTNGTIFEATKTVTLNNFVTNGTAGNLVKIYSDSAGSPFTLSKSSGTVEEDYMDIKDSTATGGATWVARSSVNSGGNTGWTFEYTKTIETKGDIFQTGITKTVTAKAKIVQKRFWVTGGDGNWSNTNNWSYTSGGSSGAPIPTLSDDVYLDANSGAGTATMSNSNGDCKDIDFTGFTGTFTSTVYNINVYGSINISAGMTWSFTYRILFESTGAETITTNGQTLNCEFEFNGSGGSWTLQDALNLGIAGGNDIDLNQGTLDLNGQTVTCDDFRLDGSSTRTLTMGASTVNVDNTWDANPSTNLTLNANTSSIVFTAGAGLRVFDGGGQTYNNLTYTTGSQDTIHGANTFNNLTFTGSGVTNRPDHLAFSDNVTVSGTFTASASSANLRTVICSGVAGINGPNRTAQRTLTCAAVSFTNVDFMDINGAGAAASFSASGCGDIDNNDNITFDATVTRYWIGDSGNWSDVAEWSASTGGGGGASVPLAHDSAVFDGNSFSGGGLTVVQNMTVLGGFDFSAVTNTPEINFSSGAYVGGTVTLDSGMTTTGSGDLIICSASTLTSGGQDLRTPGNDLRILIPTASTVTLADNLTIASIRVTIGTFDVNDNDITMNSLALGSSGATVGTYKMGDGTTTIASSNSSYFYSGSVVTPESSTLILSTGTVTLYIFNDPTFNDVTVTSDNVRFLNGGFTCATLTLNTGGDATGTIFEAGETFTVSSFVTNGSSGNLVKILSDSAGNPFSLFKSSGTVEEEYMDIKDSTATGGATWIAFDSVDSGGNTDWIFRFLKTIEAKGDIFNTVTQTVDSKGDIKQTGITKTIAAKGRTIFTYENTITAKGRIEKTETQTIDAKGNIEVTTEQAITAKGRIETTEDQTIQAKGNVKVTTEQTITSKGNIKVTTEQTAQAKGDIKHFGVTKTISAKARLVNTYSPTTSAKGDIKVFGETKTIEAKGDILYVRTNTIDSKGLIKALGVTKTIGAKARVRFFYTQTIEAKASIKNTRKSLDVKGHIITDWQIAQPKLGSTVLPFPNKPSIKRVRHKGEKNTIAGKKKQDNTGEKYQYKMSWDVMRPDEFDALEEEIKTGEPVIFTYDKWPQSSGEGIAVLGKLSPRKYVYGTGTTDYLSNVSVTLTEAEPR